MKPFDIPVGIRVRALRDLDPDGARIKVGTEGVVIAPAWADGLKAGPLVQWPGKAVCNVYEGDVEDLGPAKARKQDWLELNTKAKGRGTWATYALELPHGCLVLVDQGPTMTFVPGVRISDAHGLQLAAPSRDVQQAQQTSPIQAWAGYEQVSTSKPITPTGTFVPSGEKPELPWEIGATAQSIKFVHTARKILDRDGLSVKVRDYLEKWINRVQRGEEAIPMTLDETAILAMLVSHVGG